MEKALAVSLTQSPLFVSVGTMKRKPGREQVINPGGEIRRFGIVLAEPVARKIERQAKKRGVSMAQIIREALEQVA